MESKAINLGNSLLVPCVQELARDKSLTTIPPRYIRYDQQQPIVSDEVSQIPVIDMRSLLSEGSMEAESSKLDCACREWGFFQLVNHGVSSSLLEKVKKEIQDFFNLPIEEKKKYWQYPGEVEGFGQAFVVSEEQKLDWGDLFFMTTLPHHFRKPHLFPKLPLSFRDTLEIYSLELKNLAITILKNMANALDMESGEMEEFFEEGFQSMRMNYYPPCPEPDKVMGLTPHSDSVGLTILLQINEVEGLQIKKDGKWIPIKPLPNAFIINIGDVLEVITNGAYRSITHRATINSERERLSIATFYNPKYDGEIGPARSLISQQKPALFKRLGVEEYFKGLFARSLNEKSYLDTLRLQQG
ncbi:hypothetical protein SLE2022_312830 [Rubroshorea leprosula]